MRSKTFRFAWLLSLLLAATLACNFISGISKDVREVRETGGAIITQAQGLATQGGRIVDTIQAYATENPELAQTLRAFATEDLPALRETGVAVLTENPEVVETIRAFATNPPGLLETAEAFATDIAGGAEEVAEDIPLVEESTRSDFLGTESFVSYTTSLNYSEVLDFYKTEMPSNGWAAVSAGTFETENAAVLNYEKTDRTVNIILGVIPGTNQTTVLITISAR